ncbi:MAG TPA: 30S ribosomal protein S8 [Acidimicrobiia bacterium]|jgi:small subunit ribosomal protein S8|uniref:Small ribosomal subunit protein uS8 n=1 Tax=uncultured actinobacterium Rifle_16ft_4_minimus_3564 TaxID=1665147 RepID=A0A0H4T3E4_9ACTN|nr:30S ribosomal protein S8 [uncultured actinobacterium Rifle_16ft_4_minimus_3564]HKZ30511.1 30S ribosomal protein S8 [Acidimicrobiia bacterium]
MNTDPIADMLTRIRNGNQAVKHTISMPSSKVKTEVAKILAAEGFIDGFDVQPKGPGLELTVKMKYAPGRARVIQGIRRVSSPGHRVYRGASDLPRSQGGLGVIVVSTSQGLLPDREARRRRLGGEIICEVW